MVIKYLALILLFSFSASAEKIYNNYSKISFNDNFTRVVTPWNHDQGIKIFETAKYKKDFYHLAHLYQPQTNPLYCGIASSAIILNALNIGGSNMHNSVNYAINPLKIPTRGDGLIEGKKPDKSDDVHRFVKNKINFKFYTQDDVLNHQTEKIKSKGTINFRTKDKNGNYDPGLTLRQLSDILKSHGLKTKIFYAKNQKKKGVEKFTKNLKSVLNDNNKYIVANFHGKTFGAKTGGHISPVVSYNDIPGDILILDVAAHKNPWYWVKIGPFYDAMQKKDGNLNRVYIIVSK